MIPRITQQNVHLFIPHKAAYIAEQLEREEGLTLSEALVAFYASKTYALLEREETKLWQDNVKQLWCDFKREYDGLS